MPSFLTRGVPEYPAVAFEFVFFNSAVTQFGSSQFFEGDLVVRVNAGAAGDLHGFFGDLPRRELRVLEQSPRRAQRVRSTGTDGGHAFIRFDYVAGAGDQKCLLFVARQQQGLKVAQRLVGAPLLGQLDAAASEVAVVLLQLGLEAAEEREGVGGRSGEAGNHLVLVEAADLARAVLDDAVTERDLPF